MTSRFKALFIKVLYTLLVVVAIMVFISIIVYNSIDNKILCTFLICTVLLVLFWAAYRFLLETEETEFDDRGIVSYRFKEKEVYCSWESIQKVEIRKLPRVGKMIFVYNDKYSMFSPFRIKSAKYDAISIPYSIAFIDTLNKHRPDIVPVRID